jgi:hypothetical protein
MSIVFNKTDTNKSNRGPNQFNHPWTRNEIKFVQNNMKKMTYKEMGSVINRTVTSIQSEVRYLPLKQKIKKYSINNNFFKKWSEQMAYVLGFVASDGNICKSGNSHMLQLASDDKDIMIKIKKVLISKAPIHLRGRLNGKISYQLRHSDPIIYNDLLKLGIKPRKSLTISPQKIPAKYTRHYLRGFFDGDGSVYCSHKTRYKRLIMVLYTASPKMASFLYRIIRKKCPIFKGKIQKILTPKKNRYYYSIVLSHNNALLMYSYMYSKATIFMERKYNKFLEAINEN